jgi:hypothetical protein
MWVVSLVMSGTYASKIEEVFCEVYLKKYERNNIGTNIEKVQSMN